MTPSTVASRRATWGQDALQLVADLRRAARGQGGEPWRIAYLAGAKVEAIRSSSTFLLLTTGVRPGCTEHIRIDPEADGVGQADIDAIAWHMDQDARRGDLEDGERDWLPAGPLLVDPLFAALLGKAGMDEEALRWRIEAAVEGDGARGRRATMVPMPAGLGTTRVGITIRMNEVGAEFHLPCTTRATWKSGFLVVERDQGPMPETVLLGMRGRPLAEIVDHPLATDAPAIRVTGAVDGAGRLGITTDARSPCRLQPIGRPPTTAAQ